MRKLDEKIVSNSEAVESFKKCLSWMERQNNVDATQNHAASRNDGILTEYMKFYFDRAH